MCKPCGAMWESFGTLWEQCGTTWNHVGTMWNHAGTMLNHKNIVSTVVAWFPLVLTWFHMVPTLFHVVLHGSYMIPTWFHVVSYGSTFFHMVATWLPHGFHIVSILFVFMRSYVGPHMVIYGPYGPTRHIWSLHGRIWSIRMVSHGRYTATFCSYMVTYGPWSHMVPPWFLVKYGPYMVIYGSYNIWSLQCRDHIWPGKEHAGPTLTLPSWSSMVPTWSHMVLSWSHMVNLATSTELAKWVATFDWTSNIFNMAFKITWLKIAANRQDASRLTGSHIILCC